MSMFSFLSRKNAPPGSPSPGNAQGGAGGSGTPPPPSVDDVVADLKREFDRRLEALSLCLDEKSQENTQLDLLLKDREESEKQLRTRIATLEVDLEAERDVVREYQRRLEAMTRVLEDSIMSQNNTGVLPQFSDIENEKFLTQEEVAQRKATTSRAAENAMEQLPPGHFAGQPTARTTKSKSSDSSASKKNSATDSKDSESAGKSKKSKEKSSDKTPTSPTLAENQEESGASSKPIKRAEKVGAKKTDSNETDSAKSDSDPLKITDQEQREPIKALQDAKQVIFKLKKETTILQQKNEALAESICKYESKLVKADKTFRENLFKESRRRKDAEYVASVLKKRVTQLQFLLDERDSTDEDEGSESSSSLSKSRGAASKKSSSSSSSTSTATPKSADENNGGTNSDDDQEDKNQQQKKRSGSTSSRMKPTSSKNKKDDDDEDSDE